MGVHLAIDGLAGTAVSAAGHWSAGRAPMAARIVEVRPSVIADVYALADNLRPLDLEEVTAFGADAKVALRRTFRDAILRHTYLIEGTVAAMSGLCGSMLSDVGEPYLLTAPSAASVPLSFVKLAANAIAEMLGYRSRLERYVTANYHQACRTLEMLGFVGDAPRFFGPQQVPFRRFSLNRDEWHARLRQNKIVRPGAEPAPYMVYTTGRSRTAWLASFLTYGGHTCHNEVAVNFRSIDEVRQFFSHPGVGSAETGAAPGWRLINHYFPNIRNVVVRRPVDDVIASFTRIAAIDDDRLRKIIAYETRCMEKISALPGTLTVEFADLQHEKTCAAVFEHCLPYRFDRDWWMFMRDRNVQASVSDLYGYYQQNRAAIDGFKQHCKRHLSALVRSGALVRS